MILLINPRPSLKAPCPEHVSLSLGTIATYIGTRFKVKIVNDSGNLDELESAIREARIIGLTGLTYQAERAMQLAGFAKEKNPDCLVVMGGVFASLNWKNLLSECKEIDYVIAGEGERSFLSLCKGGQSIPGIAERKNEVPILHEPVCLDISDLPITDRSLIPGQAISFDHAFLEKSAAVMFSRGCNGTCTFCATPQLFGKTRFRLPEQAVEEINYLIEEFNVNCFAFEDDNFLSDTDFVNGFIRESANLKTQIRFRINARISDLQPELLRDLKNIGLSKITFGLEHTDRNILKLLGKPIAEEGIEKAMALCRKLDLLAAVLFMAGCPGETSETLDRLHVFAQELKPNGGFDFQVFQPHPGHRIESICKDKGRILTNDYNQFFSDNVTFQPKAFPDLREYVMKLRTITGKHITAAEIEFPSLTERLEKAGTETVAINPANYCREDFNHETSHWQGSERCMTGLSIIKCLDHGSISYCFSLDKQDGIKGIKLHARLASHPVDWPQGPEFCSDMSVLINGKLCANAKLNPVHTMGEYRIIELDISKIQLLKENTLTFKIHEGSRGLSIFWKPLHPFYKECVIPIILEISRRLHE